MRRPEAAGTTLQVLEPLDEAWAVPTGQYADDVCEATERLACRMGSFDEAVEELRYLDPA